jgi:hypothetical protein
MHLRTTHTYVELELSPAAYDEIAGKLKAADYGHAFMDDGAIDMHGLAVTRAPEVHVEMAPGAEVPTMSVGTKEEEAAFADLPDCGPLKIEDKP